MNAVPSEPACGCRLIATLIIPLAPLEVEWYSYILAHLKMCG